MNWKKQGGEKIKDEFLQRRFVFELPTEKKSETNFLRVRDEGDCITLTLKDVKGNTITGQTEIQIMVSDFEMTGLLLESMGCTKESHQESKRELWKIGNTEIMFDTWPFLDTYVEIEGESESSVKEIAEALGLDYTQTLFSTVNALYKMKYGLSIHELSKEKRSSLTFSGENPFL